MKWGKGLGDIFVVWGCLKNLDGCHLSCSSLYLSATH